MCFIRGRLKPWLSRHLLRTWVSLLLYECLNMLGLCSCIGLMLVCWHAMTLSPPCIMMRCHDSCQVI